MERRDYLVRQLEQMLKVLSILIGRLLGFKPEELPSAMDFVKQTMADSLQIDFNELVSVPPSDLPEYLKSQKIQIELFDQLAEVLFRIGELHFDQQPEKAKKYFKQSLAMYTYLNTDSRLLSFGRNVMIEKVEKKLNRLL